MSLKVIGYEIQFYDSFMYMPLGLSKLKTSLGCQSDEKGGCPMALNHDDLIDIVMDHHPNLDCFKFHSMPEQQKEAFLTWWEENKNQPFHLLQHIVDYCVVGNSVTI